jgi:hypothetical protein
MVCDLERGGVVEAHGKRSDIFKILLLAQRHDTSMAFEGLLFPLRQFS